MLILSLIYLTCWVSGPCTVQTLIQRVLLGIAAISVPWILLVKPLSTKTAPDLDVELEPEENPLLSDYLDEEEVSQVCRIIIWIVNNQPGLLIFICFLIIIWRKKSARLVGLAALHHGHGNTARQLNVARLLDTLIMPAASGVSGG